MEELERELPNLSTFVTLSPVPGFAAWLADERRRVKYLIRSDLDLLMALDRPGWETETHSLPFQGALLRAVATYLLCGKGTEGMPLDSVARFHLGNGARLERLNFLADVSDRGLRQGHGVMVNYLYKFDEMEANQERYAAGGDLPAAVGVRNHLRAAAALEKHKIRA